MDLILFDGPDLPPPRQVKGCSSVSITISKNNNGWSKQENCSLIGMPNTNTFAILGFKNVLGYFWMIALLY